MWCYREAFEKDKWEQSVEFQVGIPWSAFTPNRNYTLHNITGPRFHPCNFTSNIAIACFVSILPDIALCLCLCTWNKTTATWCKHAYVHPSTHYLTLPKHTKYLTFIYKYSFNKHQFWAWILKDETFDFEHDLQIHFTLILLWI